MGINFVESSTFLSDEDLISAIKSGDTQAQRLLTARYKPIIIKIAAKRMCIGFDMEDLIQEGIISLFNAAYSFRSGKASFHTFAVLCINRAIAGVVKGSAAAKRIPERLVSSLEDEEISLSTAPSPEKLFIEKESFSAFTEHIRLTLSGLEYKVLNEFLAGKSYADIANELDISEKSVDNALHRIRKKLK